MSDQLTMADSVRSAATNVCDSAEILSHDAQDDGSHIITLRVEKERAGPNTQVRDTDEFKWGDTPEDDGDSESADTGDTPDAGWGQVAWNTIQQMARETEEKTTRQRPENRTKETLTEYLQKAGVSPPTGESEEDTPEKAGNDESGGSESESEDSGLSHPSECENPTAEHYRVHFGECAHPDCSYGASGEDSDTCKTHDSWTEDGEYEKQTWEVSGEELTYNALQSRAADITKVQPSWTGDKLAEIVRNGTEGADRGSEVQKVAKMFDTSPKTAEEAVEAVEDGHFETTKEAIDTLEA